MENKKAKYNLHSAIYMYTKFHGNILILSELLQDPAFEDSWTADKGQT